MPQELEYIDSNGNVHYKDFSVIVKDGPNDRAFLSPNLDFRNTFAEDIMRIFNGEIVEIRDRRGKIVYRRPPCL